MTLRGLIEPVIPNFPQVSPDMEVAVLHEIPIETLYLALKDADFETTTWFFQNALSAQTQGLIDIDCWEGDEFLPDRFESYFKNLSLLHPVKLRELMRELDAEVIVRGLLEYVSVEDFDPQNPPEVPDENLMLTPDSKFALILKTDRPDVREMLYLWLNKFSTADLDLLRRHLEACKWEQPSDLEEFGYQVKKGRIEEMGFVDRADALALYAVAKSAALKLTLLNDPLPDGSKISGVKNFADDDVRVNEEFLPNVISRPLFDDGFLFEAFGKLPQGAWREVVLMEMLRTINAALSADGVLHASLDEIKLVAVRARRYLDLGLRFLADGKLEAGTRMLEVQPLAGIYRLGWTVLHDLVNAAKELRTQFGSHFFTYRDEEFLERLHGRHPEFDSGLLRDLGVEADSLIRTETVFAAGLRLAHLAQIGKYLGQDLGPALQIQTRAPSAAEPVFPRLTNGLFREAGGESFSPAPLAAGDWTKLAANFDATKLERAVKLVVSRCPEFGRSHFERRLDEFTADLKNLVRKSPTQMPDPRFFKSLSFVTKNG